MSNETTPIPQEIMREIVEQSDTAPTGPVEYNRQEAFAWECGWSKGFREGAIQTYNACKRASPSAAPSAGWVSTKDRLPEKPCKSSYEHVWCLVYYYGNIKVLAWNCEHLCWDGEDGDDYECDPTAPTHWMLLPSPPTPGA